MATKNGTSVYTHYAQKVGGPTPQTEPLIGRTDMVKNQAGGYGFQITDLQQLERFLCMGTESGTYYTTAPALTAQNAENVVRLLKSNGPDVVSMATEWSVTGRAPRNSTSLFVLALASTPVLSDQNTRSMVFDRLPQVARTLSHLYEFVGYASSMRGWGRGLRNGISDWLDTKTDEFILFQTLKYRQRGGWGIADLLRLAHPSPLTPTRSAIYKYIVDGVVGDGPEWEMVRAYHRLRETDNIDIAVGLMRDYRLSWEMAPTEFHGSSKFWSAVLPNLPPGALLRNLARLTANGTFTPLSSNVDVATKTLTDRELLRRHRIHPANVLVQLRRYQTGHSDGRSSLVWTPNNDIVAALGRAFEYAYGLLPRITQKTLVAVDTSGSMTGSSVLGTPNLTAAMASAAIAMLYARCSDNSYIIGFDTRVRDGLGITSSTPLDSAVKCVDRGGGGTDCAAPIDWAIKNGVSADAILMLTDSQTWAGKEHVTQALKRYREKSGKSVKLFVAEMSSDRASLIDPNDTLSASGCGFDAMLPNVIASFFGQGMNEQNVSEDD